jgi:hypothetical protein
MTKQYDNLSHAIDQLNAGQKADPCDAETAELLAVAKMLRQAELPVALPDSVLAPAQEKAAAGLAAGHSRHRKTWLYSGALSAAAALLFFFGLHGFSPEVMLAPVAPTTTNSPSVPDEATIVTQAQAVTPTAPPIPANTASAEPPTPTPSKPAATPSASAMSSASPRIANTAPALVALHLPGRTPDSSVVDSSTGALRQVYESGTPTEIVITQRIATSNDAVPPNIKSQKLTMREAVRAQPEAAPAINKVTVTIAGQEVTLEGRQSRQELLDLAKTLVP